MPAIRNHSYVMPNGARFIAGPQTPSLKLAVAPNMWFDTLNERFRLGQNGVWVENQGMITFTYDFSVNGGAVGTITFPVQFPAGAVIVRSWYDVITPLVGSGASIAIGTGEAANDILAATAITTSGTSGQHDGISAHTATTGKKTTAIRQPTLTISGAALTAGKINVFCEFVVSN